MIVSHQCVLKLTNEVEKFHLKFRQRILPVRSKFTNLAAYAKLDRMLLITSTPFDVLQWDGNNVPLDIQYINVTTL